MFRKPFSYIYSFLGFPGVMLPHTAVASGAECGCESLDIESRVPIELNCAQLITWFLESPSPLRMLRPSLLSVVGLECPVAGSSGMLPRASTLASFVGITATLSSCGTKSGDGLLSLTTTFALESAVDVTPVRRKLRC
jgi:hypothetical protein